MTTFEEHFECRTFTVTEYSYTLVLLLSLYFDDNTFILLLEEHFECRTFTVTEYSHTLVLLLLLKYKIYTYTYLRL